MKKILLVIAAIALLTVALSITAFAAEVDGVYYDLDAKNQVATVNTKNKTATAEIATIPSEIEFEGVTYRVTKIANDAFAGNKTVKEIRILSEYITAIPYGMIVNTYDGALEKIYIDFSNITTYAGAALNPSDQSNGNSPKSNKFYYYDAKAFLETGEDVVITEPDFSNVTSFGAAAFQGANFEKVVIPDTIKDLNNQIFRKSTIKELVIKGDTLETISYYVFQACTNLKKITIESCNLKSVSNDVFAGCTAVEEIYIDMSKCEEVRGSAFMFASKYDAGQSRVQWYNPDGEKILDLSSMKRFVNGCFASANIGSATIIWPEAITLLEDQCFRLCNINQPIIINAAEGVTLTLPFWAFNGNNPPILLCNEGVTATAARFTSTTAVFLAPSLTITDGERGFKSASTLYTYGLSSDSKVPKENEATVINISAGNIYNYGACGIVASVTTAEGNVTIGTVSHTTNSAVDNTLCPIGKVTVTACKFCDYAVYTVDGEEVERAEHSFDLENGETGAIVYTDYLSMGYKSVLCASCTATKALDTATEDALFVSKGISVKMFGDAVALVQGYGLNKNAIEAYKKYASDFDFGILAYANVDGGAVAPKPGDDKVVDISFDNMANDYIEVMLAGIPADKQDVKLVFCIYATQGDGFCYIDDGVMSDTVVGKSYNDIVSE